MEGEGYFEVARNEKLPFIVNAKEIDVKVLGTKFNVKAYSDEQEIAVTLAEGSVNMIDKAAPSNSVIMVPQQQAIYNKLTEKQKYGKFLRRLSVNGPQEHTSSTRSVSTKLPDNWKKLST